MTSEFSRRRTVADHRPRIVVLTTGGTIASRPVKGRGVIATEGGATLLAAVPQLEDISLVEHEELFCIGSYLLSVEQMLTIAARVRALCADPSVAGVVVTHGTNTLEETAYLIDLLHNGETPVVLTGAQRNLTVEGSDGPQNLLDSVTVAASSEARGSGALVVMNGDIHGAREATKVHTSSLNAFDSPGYGAVGSVRDGRVNIFRNRVRNGTLARWMGGALPRVELIKLVAGSDGFFLRAARESGVSGLVVEAFGKGNATPEVLSELRFCVAERMSVMIVSRCQEGRVEPLYGNGGGHDLVQAGALMAGDLSGQKARILLMLALAVARDGSNSLDALTSPHLEIQN